MPTRYFSCQHSYCEILPTQRKRSLKPRILTSKFMKNDISFTEFVYSKFFGMFTIVKVIASYFYLVYLVIRE